MKTLIILIAVLMMNVAVAEPFEKPLDVDLSDAPHGILPGFPIIYDMTLVKKDNELLINGVNLTPEVHGLEISVWFAGFSDPLLCHEVAEGEAVCFLPYNLKIRWNVFYRVTAVWTDGERQFREVWSIEAK